MIILDAMNKDSVLLVEVHCRVADEKAELPPWSGIRDAFIVVFSFKVERTLRGYSGGVMEAIGVTAPHSSLIHLHPHTAGQRKQAKKTARA